MKKLSVLVLIVVVSASLSSCGKDYLNINTPNPNAATGATPQLVITSAMTTTASFQVAQTGMTPLLYLNGWMGVWGQSGSYATSNTDISSYNETTNYANAFWIQDYRNLEDYDFVEKSSEQQLLPYYTAMAKTMKAVVFGQLVDLFNNVPYKQAFQGTTIITPAYDKGQDIYEALAVQLDSAVILMQSPASVATTATSDVMFYGKNLQWEQFANTLKLRLLMHQSQMVGRDAYISGEIAKIVANGAGFLTVDAAVNPGTATSQGYANNDAQQNPIWGFFITLTGLPTSGGGDDLYRAGAYGINTLKALNDPRLPLIYDSSSAGTYVGSVLGDNTNPPGQGTSHAAGPGILQSVSQSAIILSAAESHFLQAEAIVRGWLPGGDAAAKVQYEAGVQSSFTYLGAGNATTYLASGNPLTTWSAATGTAAKIALIIQQKWIAAADIVPIEQYNDYRRLGQPNIPISISNYKNPPDAKVPTRFLYPVSEYTTNGANVNAEGNINYYTDKVFWNQ
jgi:Starch-binding associating with outer membrane